jgi:hypothetical protein
LRFPARFQPEDGLGDRKPSLEIKAMQTELRLKIKTALAQRDLKLIEVSRRTGIPYDRLSRIVNGYRPARPDELDAIWAAIEGVS